MTTKPELFILIVFTFISSTVYGYLTPIDDDYVQNTLSKCSSSLYDLTVCLAEEKTLIFEVRKCDGLLSQTLLCLSRGPNMYEATGDDAEMEENSLVVKRGLGRCIHKCLKGQGRMNFIQCKSMCHR